MPRPKTATPKKLLTACVDPELLQKAVLIAAITDTSLSREVRGWVGAYVSRYEDANGAICLGSKSLA